MIQMPGGYRFDNATLGVGAKGDGSNWGAQRELFERSLLQQEQARRMYDSETQRSAQQQKYGVLAGLLKNVGGGGGYSGYSVDGQGRMSRF